MKWTALIGLLLMTACTTQTPEPISVTLMLDWVPNTNHTGIYVAKNQGYFEQAGLEVEIVQPGEVFAEQAVAGGAADFGISFQESLTLARADDVPLVSIAAILQHNTSGFASRSELGVDSPADWEGLRYGSFGSDFEDPTLQGLMGCDGGDFSALERQNVGFADPLALLAERQIDLAWIFYGWQGIQALQQGIDLEVVMMQDWFDCIPDYYTPIVIASESTIEDRPKVVASFLEALSRGYSFAIDDPVVAAEILNGEVPELDQALLEESQAWMSPRYRAEAERWGEQDLEVWNGYSQWMTDHGIIDEAIEAERAFTNEFLP